MHFVTVEKLYPLEIFQDNMLHSISKMSTNDDGPFMDT